jgi:hypothetical protein
MKSNLDPRLSKMADVLELRAVRPNTSATSVRDDAGWLRIAPSLLRERPARPLHGPVGIAARRGRPSGTPPDPADRSWGIVDRRRGAAGAPSSSATSSTSTPPPSIAPSGTTFSPTPTTSSPKRTRMTRRAPQQS